jgi:hypothetical protein
VFLESSRKVTLIVEAGGESDLRERRIRQRKFAAGKLDPQSSYVFPYGTSVILPKYAG